MSKKIGSLSVCGAAMFLSMLVSSAFGYEKEIEQLSSQMAEKIAGKGKKTVAVIDFTDLEGNVTQLDRFITEEFSVALAGSGKGFRVIDSNELNSIIKKHKLAATGLIDPETARKIGKIAGVDVLVTGTMTRFSEKIKISLKLIDTEILEIIFRSTYMLKTIAVSEFTGKEIEKNTAIERQIKANLDFPEKINSDSSAPIRIYLDAKKEVESLKQRIRDKIKDIGIKVTVSDKLIASLSGLNFEIINTTPDMQIALEGDIMEWSWDVKPKSHGTHSLYLTISIVLNVEDEKIQKIIYEIEKKIVVNATRSQQLTTFIKDNWQWLWATVLVPIIGLFLKKRKPKRRNAIS